MLAEMVRAMLDDEGNKVMTAYRITLETMLAAPSQIEQDAARWQEFRTNHCASPDTVQMLIDDAIASRKESAALVLG